MRILPEPPQQLVARDMGTVRYLACAARTYADAHGLPTELAQLGSLPVVTANVVGRPLSVRGYRGDSREEVQLAPALISDHYPFLRQGVLAGLGIGLLPDYMVQDVCFFLEALGVSVEGIGTTTLTVRGRPHIEADVSIAPTIIMGTIFRFIAFTIPFDSKRAGHFWPAQPAE